MLRPVRDSDDVVVDRNGCEIVLWAAMVADFSGDKISAFRNYFDDATLMKQMPAARAPRLVESSQSLVIEDAPDPADLALLEEQVAAAATAAAGVRDEQEFGIFLRDNDGRMLAGISGVVWGGCCELQAMWVTESLRGRGLARALIAGAEAEAERRGCALIMFLAYDLLAREFYDRLGYQRVGVIEGCPAGSAARWYRKDL